MALIHHWRKSTVMSQEPIIFDNGDGPFFEWMKNYPEGFVLNTERGREYKKIILHMSDCDHISKYKES